MLKDGKGGLYDYCAKCGRLVKLNKFLFGDLHICCSDEEAVYYAKKRVALKNSQLNNTGVVTLLKGTAGAGAALSYRTGSLEV